MRTIYDAATGADNTSTAQAALQAGNSFVMADLFTFVNNDFWTYNAFQYKTYFTLTNASFPINVKYLQLFASGSVQLTSLNYTRMDHLAGVGTDFILYKPEKIMRGQFSYEVGLSANNTSVTWYIDPTIDYFKIFAGTYIIPLISPAVNVLSMKQSLSLYHAFDGIPFWIHRAIFTDFPSNGGTFLGTTLMFRGYINEVEAAPDYVKLNLNSLMQVVQDIQVPTQLIVPGNRNVPYLANFGATPFDGSSAITVISPVTIQMKLGATVTENQYQDCFMSFSAPANGYQTYYGQNGFPSYSVPAWKIQSHTAGSSGGTSTITFYDPPIICGYTFYTGVYTQTGGSAPGFAHVPPPENSI